MKQLTCMVDRTEQVEGAMNVEHSGMYAVKRVSSDYLSNFHRNEAIICLVFLVMFIVLVLNPSISFVPFLACSPGGFAMYGKRNKSDRSGSKGPVSAEIE